MLFARTARSRTRCDCARAAGARLLLQLLRRRDGALHREAAELPAAMRAPTVTVVAAQAMSAAKSEKGRCCCSSGRHTTGCIVAACRVTKLARGGARGRKGDELHAARGLAEVAYKKRAAVRRR
jgi:hypothetical protein